MMNRRLAGTFDPTGRAGPLRLPATLRGALATAVQRPPLSVAFSGGPVAAHEPFCLLDGWIDNAAQLSAELGMGRGAGEAGPEALLGEGWRRWRQGLLARLRGDFVLLIWDQKRGEGVLARDQLGVRSLFLGQSGEQLCFAGELRDLLALLPQRPAPDMAGLAHWVAGVGRPGAETLYAGVRRLEPGNFLQLGTEAVREQRYWRLRFREPAACSAEHACEEVRDAIALAVRRRLDANGTTGVLMSGGLDSSAIAAVAAARAPGRIAAYSGVFPDHPAVDESELIDELRRRLRLPGVTATVLPGGLLASALTSQATWQAPLVGWGEFWTLPLLRQAAKDGVEIVLDGDGGDELFAVRKHLLADFVRRGRPDRALALLRRLPGAADRPPVNARLRVAGNLALAGALPIGLHHLLLRRSSAHELPRWLTTRGARYVREAADPLAWKRLDGPRWWASVAHTLTRGVEELGVFEGLRRTAELAGTQARHPLFDVDLIELVLGQPPSLSFDAHVNRPVLRASMIGLLPDSIRMRRRKAMFDSLIVDSLLGADGAAVHSLLANPKSELAPIVDLPSARRALLGRSHAQPFIATQYIWRLVTAECWLRTQAEPRDSMQSLTATVSKARVSMRASMLETAPTRDRRVSADLGAESRPTGHVG